MIDPYKKPFQAGVAACIAGLPKSRNPCWRRFSANEHTGWNNGWDSVNKTNGCKGIKVAHQNYSGCLGLSDCPVCEGKS